jgi:hypothetical protein
MPVTEAEWLVCKDPFRMLNHLAVRTRSWPARLLRRFVFPKWYPCDLDWERRKLRLLACACCRRVAAQLPDERSRLAIEISERFADGLATGSELAVAAREAEAAAHDAGNEAGPWELTPERYASVEAAQAASYLVRRNGFYPPLMMALYEAPWAATWATLPSSAPVSLPGVAARPAFVEQASLIRELFGNPFRPGMLVDPVWLVSRGGIVPQLAQAAYQERRLPEGALDSARLAELADALEDAGCTDADLLGHLRSPGPHVRGCWAVDLVLGKS